MSAPNINSEDAKTFKALFSGYSQAHGTFEINETDPQTGKKKGNARTIRRGATLQEWEEHLAGGPKGLGTIPLIDDGVSVTWAAIDIDVCEIDLTGLDAKVRELDLPLVVCRSKSGGAHGYLFLVAPAPAKNVVEALANWAAALGHPDVEIFPKQTRREVDEKTGNPRPGNWINLPYHGAEATDRYCVNRGDRLPLREFIDLAEGSRAGQDALKIRHITTIRPEKSQSPKSREGRNGYLFSRACSMRKSGMPGSEINEALITINQLADQKTCPNFSQGPLAEKEVADICKSAMTDRYAPNPDSFADPPYFISENQLARSEHTSKGRRITVLSNFTGEIVEDICRDDGAGEVREYHR